MRLSKIILALEDAKKKSMEARPKNARFIARSYDILIKKMNTELSGRVTQKQIRAMKMNPVQTGWCFQAYHREH